jgi:hypothetical protein
MTTVLDQFLWLAMANRSVLLVILRLAYRKSLTTLKTTKVEAVRGLQDDEAKSGNLGWSNLDRRQQCGPPLQRKTRK